MVQTAIGRRRALASGAAGLVSVALPAASASASVVEGAAATTTTVAGAGGSGTPEPTGWVSRATTETSVNYVEVTYGSGTYVALAQGGSFLVSSDGSNWSSYNNVAARLRRMAPNLREASADLGADGWQTFRHVTWPLVRGSVVAGAILAFALSFDEIVVTTFTSGAGVETLPQWILNNFSRPNVLPYVTVVATIVMVISIPLAWFAQRLSDGVESLAGR